MTNCFPDEFPLLTTKRVFWKGVLEELLWFIKVKELLLLEVNNLLSVPHQQNPLKKRIMSRLGLESLVAPVLFKVLTVLSQLWPQPESSLALLLSPWPPC